MKKLLLVALSLLFALPAGVQGADVGVVPGNNSSALVYLPDVRQGTNYTCGVSCMQSVLYYWGKDVEEDDLARMLNTTSESGTYPQDMVSVARRLGFQAEYRDNLTLEDLEESLRQGIPVIIDGQAWRDPADNSTPWSEEWDEGHYMVVLGMDDQKVYLEDPWILGGRGFMTRPEFLERWHNPRGLTPSDEVKQIHLGVFVRGDRHEVPVPFRHVD
jgi:uncharacterized protein